MQFPESNKESDYFEAANLAEPMAGKITGVGETPFYLFKNDDGSPDETGPKKPWIQLDCLPKPIGCNWSNTKLLKSILGLGPNDSGPMEPLIGKHVAVDREFYEAYGKWGFKLRKLSNLEAKALQDTPPGQVYQGQGTSTPSGKPVDTSQPHTTLESRENDAQREQAEGFSDNIPF